MFIFVIWGFDYGWVIPCTNQRILFPPENGYLISNSSVQLKLIYVEMLSLSSESQDVVCHRGSIGKVNRQKVQERNTIELSTEYTTEGAWGMTILDQRRLVTWDFLVLLQIIEILSGI